MATPRSPTDGPRRASRNISHPLKRRSTKGPLDAEEDPLNGRSEASALSSPTQPSSSVASTTISTVDVLSLPAPASQLQPVVHTLDLSFLQDRRSYHKVPVDDIPQSFLKSSNQPALGTALSDLLRDGHFRRAADAALNDLLHCPANEPSRLLYLLYCRLACLVLIARHDLAADEAMPFYEYITSNAPELPEVLLQTPWELRVLLVRLQSFSAQDGGRRGIMSIYSLASEVRSHIRNATDSTDREIWEIRLKQLGLHVADALVETGELETASRHLDSLQHSDHSEISARKALLYIHSGDLTSARNCLEGVQESRRRVVLETLLRTARGTSEQSLAAWRELSQAESSDQLALQNEAVFLLYTGRITEARSMLANMIQSMPVNPTLLFNLSTVHELCSEKGMLQKVSIAETLATKSPNATSGGWERSNGELKL